MMQRKRRPRRPLWQMVIAMVVGAGAIVHGTKAQSVLLVGEPVSLAEIVQADGKVRLPGPAPCVGWKLRLDPMLRARFVYTGGSGSACRARTERPAPAYWDDQLVLLGMAGQVRAFVGGGGVVYVDSRFTFRQSGLIVSGILKWDAKTGRWQVVGETHDTPSETLPVDRLR